MDYIEQSSDLQTRFASWMERMERVYLRILRGAILVIATLMIVGAIVLGVWSAFQISRSEASVVEETANVSAIEVSKLPAAKNSESERKATKKSDAMLAEKQFYREFINRYHKLFAAKFEPYRQADDKRLSAAEFGDAFIAPGERVEAIQSGNLSFAEDKQDLETMLTTLAAVAELPETKKALGSYKAARKVKVCRKVERSRTETQRGWNSYSTDCAYWYESPTGCPVTRTVDVPYTATECTMQFPEGTRSHSALLRDYQDRYFSLLLEKRGANAAAAETERLDIRAGNAAGELSLMTALQILGAFLLLMFFFLLIAIERHQRKIAQELN